MSGFAPAPTFPVIEIFGPVIQGEGLLAGAPTHFIRFGGCDYRCSWCDSMFAVEPAQVRKNAEKLNAGEIIARIQLLGQGPAWVTLSGGNPAMLKLFDVVHELQVAGFKVCVETQGSRWADWLMDVDCLTVSPKPPSSSMVTTAHDAETEQFMRRANSYGPTRGGATSCLKVVVFDDADYEWASAFFARYPAWPAFLSVGTDPVGTWGSEVIATPNHRYTVEGVGTRYAWLCEKAAGDPAMANVRVLPQLHVVAFGHMRGV